MKKERSKRKKRLKPFLVVLLLLIVFSQTVSANALIKAGSNGQAVRQMQQRLYELGYPVGAIDGYAGPATIDALILFQRMNNLDADGVAGPETLRILYSGVTEKTEPDVSAPVYVQPEVPKPRPVQEPATDNTILAGAPYKMGSKGEKVSLLQSRLKELGFYTGNPDGEFGPMTYGAVLLFQRANGLAADGIVGAGTLEILFNSDSVKDRNSEAGEKAANAGVGNDVVAYAMQYLGTPYVYGGNGPKSFDCSGFTCFVFKYFGVQLPRVACDQRTAGYGVSQSELLPGDLLLFTDVASGSYIGHAGIYIGNGEFIHASSGSSMRVRIDSIFSSHYAVRYHSARRIVE